MKSDGIFHKIKQNQLRSVFIALGIVLIGSYFIFQNLPTTNSQDNDTPLGFDKYTFTESDLVFRILFPTYETNPNENVSMYSRYELFKGTTSLIENKFDVLINRVDTEKSLISSHQARKIFDYEAFTEPRIAMYSFYLSAPKDGLPEATADQLIQLATHEASLANSELQQHRIINYKGTTAIEYEYKVTMDNLHMISKHLSFVTNQKLVDMSIVRSVYLSEEDVFWDQFINSLEFVDSRTASLILGSDLTENQ